MGSVKPLSARQTRRLVVVSNRGPCTFRETATGIQRVPSISGLVSALEPVLAGEGGSWIAWGGRHSRREEAIGLSLPMPAEQPNYVFHEVMLTKPETELYYDGFANGCLWPLCHNFIERCVFDEELWQTFRRVNEKYAEVVLKKSRPHDLIWVHDYHLAKVPALIRKHRPNARVALFWHIPFPPADIFAIMPWAKEYIGGMLGAELIGFHTENYVRNFLLAAEEIAGARVNYATGTIYLGGHTTRIAAVPIGINWSEFRRLAGSDEIREKAAQIRRAAGGEYLLLGVDRLDYTKGIPDRLKAVRWLLENYPEYRRKLSFIQIAVPSRAEASGYRELRREIEETVGRINGSFTVDYHVPVKYLFRSLDKTDLVAHYLAADMALVTPVRDGLNLVAKEYIAAKADDSGVLVLSPFAGAAGQLKHALIANPYDYRQLAARIREGLEMSETEKSNRLAALSKVVREQDIHWWWNQLLNCWLEDEIQESELMSQEAVPEVLFHEPVVGLAGRNTGAFVGYSPNPS